MNEIKLSIFGATGSIGGFTLDLLNKLDKTKRPQILLISGFNQIEKLFKIAQEFDVSYIFVPNEVKELAFKRLKNKIRKNIDILTNFTELYDLYSSVDKDSNFIINGIIGKNGMIPTFLSQHFKIFSGCANKESIIISYEFFNDFNPDLAFPLDSEHNAIYSLLKLFQKENIARIYITASGGKVYNKTEEEIGKLDISDIIKHPNWNMGKRITIDSSSGINKAFEFIEAQALFNIPKDKIEILIDRKSQIHAIIQDSSNYYFAAISNPDMNIPINMFLNKIGIETKHQALPISKDFLLFELKQEIKKTFPFLDIFIKNYDKNLFEGSILIDLNSFLQNLLFENKINFLKLIKLLTNSYLNLFINDSTDFLHICKKLEKFSFKNKESFFNYQSTSNKLTEKSLGYLLNKKIMEEKWL